MLMPISATILALAFLSGQPEHARAVAADSSSPTKTCIAPERTGTFRLFAVSARGNEPSTAILMLENIEGCLEVTFVSGSTGPAIIEGVSVTGDTLNGSLRLSTGKARVSFKFSDKAVDGSITEGRRSWKLEGHRTS